MAYKLGIFPLLAILSISVAAGAETTSSGSGFANMRSGRRGASSALRIFSHVLFEARTYCAGKAAQAASGICVSFGWTARMQ